MAVESASLTVDEGNKEASVCSGRKKVLPQTGIFHSAQSENNFCLNLILVYFLDYNNIICVCHTRRPAFKQLTRLTSLNSGTPILSQSSWMGKR